MNTARDSVRITAPAIEVIAGLMLQKTGRRHMSKSGPVQTRNHLSDLSPEFRAYVIDRCRVRGVPVTAVKVVGPDEVIIP